MLAGREIRDVVELLLYGKEFTTPDTPADNDVLIFDAGADEWRLQTNLLNPISGIAFLTEGYDLEIGDGDIILDAGKLVDGVDVSRKDADKIRGKTIASAASSPFAQVMLYYDGVAEEWKTGYPNLINIPSAQNAYHWHDADRDRANHTGTQGLGSLNVPRFNGYIASNISTNGTTYVDMTLTSSAKVLFTHTNGNAELEFEKTGDYMIALTINSNFNINNQLQYAKIQVDTGGGYGLLARSLRVVHTSNITGGALIAYILGPETFNDGDKIKLSGAFGVSDAGSIFVANRCSLSVWRIA